jgi:hypothetical protein
MPYVIDSITANTVNVKNTLLINGEEITPGSQTTYKVYTALLTQTGTDAPVATVLENTLGGDVNFTRTDVGNYLITSNELFTIGKTIVQHQFGAGATYIMSVDANYDNSELYMETNVFRSLSTPPDFEYTDNLLNGGAYTHIEIRVYN